MSKHIKALIKVLEQNKANGNLCSQGQEPSEFRKAIQQAKERDFYRLQQ